VQDHAVFENAFSGFNQSRSAVCCLAEGVGFRLQSIKGGWWLFTADFIKLDEK